MATILIIEDDLDARQLVGHTLTALGHRALFAESVAVGFEKLAQEAIDLIVLDILMPIESGLDYLERAQQDPSLANIPVVVLTAHDQFRSQDDLTDFPNVERVFLKPLGVRDLQDYVSERFPSS